MPIKKPDGWKEDLESFIAEGKTYAQVQAVLQEKYGEEEGRVGASTFGKIRKVKFPEEKRVEAIADVNERHEEAARKGKKLIKVDRKWSTQKQKAGDTSQLAGVLNQVIFYVVPCKSGKLEQKHIDEINLGGGIVNTVSYLFPGLDFSNNPIVTLLIRVGLLIIKVRKICNAIRDKFQPDVIGAPEDGLNPNFQPTVDEDGQPVKGLKLSEIFSDHPQDIYMRENNLFDEGKDPKETGK